MKFIFTNLLLLLSFCMLCCQSPLPKGEAPEAVKKNFQKMYPGENDPDWDVDRNGNYEAHFKKDGIHYRADYRPNGAWVETENSVKKKDLPEVIRDYVKDNYDKYDIEEAEFVQHHSKGEFYDIELEKGKDKFDLMITEQGKVLGKDRH